MTALTPVSSTDGVVVPVHDLGGEGPDLLFAHATGFHGLVWRPLASHLHGYHRWAPDLRGHGDAPAPTGRDFEWQGFADDVLAVVDGLGLEHPYGVGHSKGGAALLMAEQRRPGTFRALYLYEPVVFPPDADIPHEENPLAQGALRRRAVFDSHDAAFEHFASKQPFEVLDEDALRAYVEHGFAPEDDGVRLKCEPADEAKVYRMAGSADAFDHLHEVTCPVVVARGGFTAFGPGAFAPRLADELPKGQLEEFPTLGHFGPLEQPAVVAEAIARFFAGLSA